MGNEYESVIIIRYYRHKGSALKSKDKNINVSQHIPIKNVQIHQPA
ncbi:MAG: hypothetical protein ACJAXS_003111, partial [Colwellia sp.]